MSRSAAWTIGIASLLILAAGAYAILAQRSAAPAEPEPPDDPFTEPARGVSITTSGSGTVSAADFTDGGSAKRLPGSESIFVLAGEYGYCAEGMECETVETADFSIRYDQADDSFVIGLATEPLGEVRRRAESFLMAKTGLSESDMCRLKYYVGTTYWVNDAYADRNLGFSFCPGAVQLP